MLYPEGWPAPYAPPVSSPEPAIIFAITRQESNFDPEAVSGSNARGLMQLLPSTAALVARRLGVPYQLAQLTADPQANMRLGAAYLDQMLERFGGELALAAAAYNAGPNRVDQWLGTYGDPRGGGVDMIDWNGADPFTETRNYVHASSRTSSSTAPATPPPPRWSTRSRGICARDRPAGRISRPRRAALAATECRPGGSGGRSRAARICRTARDARGGRRQQSGRRIARADYPPWRSARAADRAATARSTAQDVQAPCPPASRPRRAVGTSFGGLVAMALSALRRRRWRPWR